MAGPENDKSKTTITSLYMYMFMNLEDCKNASAWEDTHMTGLSISPFEVIFMQHERNMKGNECEMKGNECNMKGNERNARHLLAFDQGYFTPTESWTIQMSSTQSSTPEKTIRARRSDNMISRYCKRHFFLIPHLLFILLQSRWFGKPGNTMAMVCGLFNFGFPFYPVSTD